MQWLILLIFLLLIAGMALLWLGRRTRETTGLPLGEVIYSDTGAEEAVEAAMISRRYGLVGRPDYLLHTRVNGQKVTIPVEVKSRKRPPVIFENHTMQLAVYCLLVEEKFGSTPPYGLNCAIAYSKRQRHCAKPEIPKRCIVNMQIGSVAVVAAIAMAAPKKRCEEAGRASAAGVATDPVACQYQSAIPVK